MIEKKIKLKISQSAPMKKEVDNIGTIRKKTIELQTNIVVVRDFFLGRFATIKLRGHFRITSFRFSKLPYTTAKTITSSNAIKNEASISK